MKKLQLILILGVCSMGFLSADPIKELLSLHDSNRIKSGIFYVDEINYDKKENFKKRTSKILLLSGNNFVEKERFHQNDSGKIMVGEYVRIRNDYAYSERQYVGDESLEVASIYYKGDKTYDSFEFPPRTVHDFCLLRDSSYLMNYIDVLRNKSIQVVTKKGKTFLELNADSKEQIYYKDIEGVTVPTLYISYYPDLPLKLITIRFEDWFSFNGVMFPRVVNREIYGKVLDKDGKQQLDDSWKVELTKVESVNKKINPLFFIHHLPDDTEISNSETSKDFQFFRGTEKEFMNKYKDYYRLEKR